MATKPITDLYELCVADSVDTQDYEDGSVPFVTSAETNNGIVRYVSPKAGDKVFSGPCLVISGLGFATVHTGMILPKGNGGDSCTVVYGKTPMSVSEYFSLAAVFNCLHKWRFTYGRKCGLNRLKDLEIPWPLPNIGNCLENQDRLAAGCLDNLKKESNERSGSKKPELWAR